MEDGEARLFGPRDGKGGGKFRGIYGLNTESAHGLSTGRAGGEIRGARVRPVFEAIAAQAAGRRQRGIGVEGHRGAFHDGSGPGGEPS